ncbi:uncharacterized protein LOC121381918 isoform X3 [Gigantopelta aegis]|uniref:uncharacterized protein LOC121381918 isoform X3 n=1 Tax=Gigantopelta aegis TaxID=1735272 RepID=UPI001B889273|nr:uncharacterized protein LOC121381918 isoform X3 [Gigantopelta aegis]
MDRKRFSDGVKDSQLSEPQESFLTEEPHKNEPFPNEEQIGIIVIYPPDIDGETKTFEYLKPKEGFLEHLLEVDKIENGHTKPSPIAVDDKDRILPQDRKLCSLSSFVETRNYLAERGVVITPRSSHEYKLFTVKGGKIFSENKDILQNCNEPYDTSGTRIELRLNQTANPTVVSSLPGALSDPCARSPASINKMSYTIDGYTSASSSRLLQEELRQLNERFMSYIQRVRQLGEQASQGDCSALLTSTKSLEQEINNLKNLYEQELQKLRDEMEALNKDKACYQVQSNKHQQVAAELQERFLYRMSGEVDKNRKLRDELNSLQRKVVHLDAELHGSSRANEMPSDSISFQRTIENLRRENEVWQKRYEHEQIARQQAEDLIQQIMKKVEFNEQVYKQQLKDLNERNNGAVATIMCLETKIRELTNNDNSVSDMLKQVREVAESELNKYKMETEAQQFRDMSGLKSQMQQDSTIIENFQAENSRLQACNDDLIGKIYKLEGQISGLESQQQTFEDNVQRERCQATENIRRLENKLRQVQDLLFAKIQEVSDSRESNVPLKTEIKALKILLEEEERRLTRTLASPTKVHASNLPISPRITESFPSRPTEDKKPSTPRSRSNSLPTSLPTPQTTTAPVSQPVNTYSYMPDFMSSPAFAPMTSDPVYDSYGYSTGAHAGYEEDFAASYTPMYVDPCEPVTSAESTSRYTYERTPNVNRLLLEQSPQNSPKDNDPSSSANSKGLRAKSAPANASARTGISLVPSSLGTGRDYFDEMFQDLQRDTLYTAVRPKSSPTGHQPYSSTTHDYTTSTSSSIGDIKILEVNQDGKFIRLFNDGAQEIEIGNYMIQQNVGGHPVAVYRFPPRVKFAGNTTITVHSGMNDVILHQPPKDFVWKEQLKWGTGPECTTILCRPCGQAIAWTTAAHRFTRDPCEEMQKGRAGGSVESDSLAGGDERLVEVNMDRPQLEPVYLKREKQQRPTLNPTRHPHGTSENITTHPHTGQARPLIFGNDNSTNSRQSRSQSMRPDPIPGKCSSGVSAQRMGSAPLRKYTTSGTLKGSGYIANKADMTPGKTSPPPSPFMKPHYRKDVGLQQLQSQHNADFIPPMPRPPLFSAW